MSKMQGNHRKHLEVAAGGSSRVLGSQLTQGLNNPGNMKEHELRLGHGAQEGVRWTMGRWGLALPTSSYITALTV